RHSRGPSWGDRPTMRFRFEPFELDIRSGELYRQGRRVRLQGHPFEVLVLLLEHPGEVVTREELHKKLWAAETFVDFEAGVHPTVKKMREGLGGSTDKPPLGETPPPPGDPGLAAVPGAGHRAP